MRLFDYGGKLPPLNSFKSMNKGMDTMKTYRIFQQHHTDDTVQPFELGRTTDLAEANQMASQYTDEQFEIIDGDDIGEITVGFQAKHETLSGYFVNRVVVEVIETELSEV